MAAGIPEYAITKDIAEEAEIRNRIMPLVQALLTRILEKTLKVKCFCSREKEIRQYSTEIPAPQLL